MYCSVKFFEPTVIVGLDSAPGTFSMGEPDAAFSSPPPPLFSSSSLPHAARPNASNSAARIANGMDRAFMTWLLPSFVVWAGGACAASPPPT